MNALLDEEMPQSQKHRYVFGWWTFAGILALIGLWGWWKMFPSNEAQQKAELQQTLVEPSQSHATPETPTSASEPAPQHTTTPLNNTPSLKTTIFTPNNFQKNSISIGKNNTTAIDSEHHHTQIREIRD